MQRCKVHFRFPDCTILLTVLFSFPEFGTSYPFHVGGAAVLRPWEGKMVLYSELFSVCSLFLVNSHSVYPGALEEFVVRGAVLRPGGKYRTLLQVAFCLIYIPLPFSCCLSCDFLNIFRQGGGPAAKVGGSCTLLRILIYLF